MERRRKTYMIGAAKVYIAVIEKTKACETLIRTMMFVITDQERMQL